MTLAQALMRRYRRSALRGRLLERVGSDAIARSERTSRFDDLSERRKPHWPAYLATEEEHF